MIVVSKSENQSTDALLERIQELILCSLEFIVLTAIPTYMLVNEWIYTTSILIPSRVLI